MSTVNECISLFPAPKAIRWQKSAVEIQNMCFPWEITKKYDFLFDHFGVRSKNRGLEIVCQEKKTLNDESYVIESERGRVVIWASCQRGQFYAVSTLLQILSFYKPHGVMPGFYIEDAPVVSFRGFLIDAARGAFPLEPELQRLLLKLSLLKFNHFALRLSDPADLEKTDKGEVARHEIGRLAALAGRMGMVLVPAVAIGPALGAAGTAAGSSGFNADLIEAFRSKLLHLEFDEKTASEPAATWFGRFLDTYRFFKAQGKTLMVLAESFLAVPEWIRKIPQDVLLLNRDAMIENTDAFRKKAAPFRKHHIAQALGTATWSRARFIPAMRRSMANNSAAFAAVREDRLAGVVLSACAEKGDGNFLEGILLPLFHAGNLFWSGQMPRPEAFSRWALGHYEPDLFRVYTFLSQVDSPLQHTHRQYLHEDPLFANFSRQDNAREIVARFRKTSTYLKKRKINDREVADYLNFAQHLYEFIADKVEFSSQFATSLSAGGENEKSRQRLERLLPAGEKLKNLYITLWLGHCRPDGLARKIREFDLLQSRFHYLLQACGQAASREQLLVEFKDQFPAGE